MGVFLNMTDFVYRKSESFSKIKTTKDSNLTDIFDELKRNLSSKDKLNDKESLILEAIEKIGIEDNSSKFILQPHVKQEILAIHTLDSLSEYIYHRYRYDTFPKNKIIDEYPPCVQIEPTSICNLRCVFCFQTDSLLTNKKEGHAGQMNLDLFKNVVDQLHNNVQFVTLASRGEPLIAKEIIPMLEYLAGKFLGLKLNTNATFLDEKKSHAILSADVNTIVFSVDSADPETYSKLRVNGNLEKVMSNIENFIKIKEKHYSGSRIITRVSGVSFNPLLQDFDETSKIWSNIVDQVAFVNYNPWENSYLKEPNSVTEACSDLWRRCFVWWDGKVNPCDVDYRSFLSVGNVQEKSISDLWNGEGYRTLRSAHLNMLRKNLKPCSGCVVV